MSQTSAHANRTDVQFVKYATVGASGYLLNLLVFATAAGMGSFNHRVAAALAFSVAVVNNFVLNRAWTFASSSGSPRVQAVRFLTASVAAFLGALAVLDLLVAAGVPPVESQALSIIVAMPLSFVVNKLWSFARSS